MIKTVNFSSPLYTHLPCYTCPLNSIRQFFMQTSLKSKNKKKCHISSEQNKLIHVLLTEYWVTRGVLCND